MEKTIRHFVVELDDLDNDFSFDSEGHKIIRQVKDLLEDLLLLTNK